jgi:enamine deaminase RidA (YjgF/YER057c/UK114 family)
VQAYWPAAREFISQSDVDAVVASVLAEPGAECLRVVVFGDADLAPDGARPQRPLVAGRQYPATGRPGVEVTAIVPLPGEDVEVVTLDPGTRLIRTHEEGAEVRRLVHVAVPSREGSTFDQSMAALAGLEAALARAGLEPRHVDRTWYFLADIEETYTELNKARDDTFERWELTTYPASTGIGAGLPPGQAVAVMAEAVARDGEPAATPFGTDLQCAPYDYGPRFVRANRSRRNGCEVVHISGISSIDPRGESLPQHDVRAAVDYAMASFTDLLASAGLAPEDLVSCYVYGKDAEAMSAFAAHCAEHGFTVPHLLNDVDVCRPELRFEIEGRAVRREHRAA